MLKRFLAWRAAKVRSLIQWGHGPGNKPMYHVTITPKFSFSLPWRGGRLRGGWHHGLQVLVWNGVGRWIVKKQLLGRSKVKGELYLEK